jgi:hypothetical protein
MPNMKRSGTIESKYPETKNQNQSQYRFRGPTEIG